MMACWKVVLIFLRLVMAILEIKFGVDFKGNAIYTIWIALGAIIGVISALLKGDPVAN